MPPPEQLSQLYSKIESGKIDDSFSVVDLLIRARIYLEASRPSEDGFDSLRFFADYIAHPNIDRSRAISFLEEACNFIAAQGPMTLTDFRLPALRQELGKLVEAEPYYGPIVESSKTEKFGWMKFYSILLEELVSRTIGFGEHISKCSDTRLRKTLERLQSAYQDSFVHHGHVMGWPLSETGPPFGFRFYIYRFEPMPKGGYLMMGARPLIAPDGFRYIPWLNPPPHLLDNA
ncbi:hypothetical protein ACFOOP_18920 [Marinicaulis aureus]|uniref:Uncharacterized protein n=1 Tax=Hyphococcus aureus TaxID=2666033 RepID=A0ABW1KZG4_9PROT